MRRSLYVVMAKSKRAHPACTIRMSSSRREPPPPPAPLPCAFRFPPGDRRSANVQTTCRNGVTSYLHSEHEQSARTSQGGAKALFCDSTFADVVLLLFSQNKTKQNKSSCEH